ncbi:hypothetical protein IU500_07905 [Nocardia terpenica]|uniref:hypothetical protein n=1 Tax=Nocardia terpenica TaxID=455432 RepID=UPI0018936479|nr:hypothetical protein [Nocardia terpenica]MBF6060700.1 hypothetical protein [Nocardia terpenica]MBF6103960.1 hypothetical protein [Nocardia terpenica]MBF6111666.1 hypothetical protein [Nocardia terpenica]MBF6118181.1 hypothetical protein [Nocardia terpenica]MBF6156425.1 hypothetical protein [Nocardia terpenica]
MTLLVLAQATNPTGPEFGKASPLGLVIILILLAGTVLLIRSMNKHIKGLPADFSPEHPEADQEADDGTEHGVAQRDSETEQPPTPAKHEKHEANGTT